MGPRIVVIDNYDSFTYNLVQALGELGCDLEVRRNDQVDVDGVVALSPDAIVLSPGPGRPEHAGVTPLVVEALAASVPMLGVCLGHQAICQVFGGTISAAPEIVHGKSSDVRHVDGGLYEGVPNPFEAGRYHSLVADRATLPDVLEVTAWTDDVVMGVRHRSLPVEGVQFHPESVLTAEGPRVLANFVAQVS
ncbi:MAG TPA: aminodeoxychorismate/anthranilate synthase component II [Acidimicrobiales bacterium]|nr:aminodeoxychorismate/anthranilate synthase component II [Acidimicrobiales bacterium]